MQDASTPRRRGPSARWILVGMAVLTGLAATGIAVALDNSAATPHASSEHHRHNRSAAPTGHAPTTTGATTSTLPPAGPGSVPGAVTAIGDSVMLDYQKPLRFALPGADVEATVSRQWSDGESLLGSIKSQGRLGGEVIVGLGTNGPITDADFDTMMSILQGASRVVFVNVHVDRPWQDTDNGCWTVELCDTRMQWWPSGPPWRTRLAMVRGGRNPSANQRTGSGGPGLVGGDHAHQGLNPRAVSWSAARSLPSSVRCGLTGVPETGSRADVCSVSICRSPPDVPPAARASLDGSPA